jgi:hypothetical protein
MLTSATTSARTGQPSAAKPERRRRQLTLRHRSCRCYPSLTRWIRVAVWEDSSSIGFPKNTPAPANFFDWRRMNDVFDVFTDMAAIRWDRAKVTGGLEPELISGRRVMSNFLDVLGTKPIYGRNFTETEDRYNAPVVVVSYGFESVAEHVGDLRPLACVRPASELALSRGHFRLSREPWRATPRRASDQRT